MIETDLGCVTAYADAVAQGYTGTRKEFGQVLANFADSATQVAKDRTAVETAKKSVEVMQSDVTQKQETATSSMNTAVEAAEKAKQSASDAEASKQAAAQSEQNINNTVTAFDNHVEEKIAGFDSRVFEVVEQSKEEINTTKQQAIDTITNQQDASVNIVKTEGEKIITKVGNDAKTVADDRATVEEATQTVLNNAQEVAQNTQTVASNTEKAAASAEGAKTSADNAAQSAKSVEDASKQIEQNKKDVDSLKEDISTKITKFYASSQGEAHITDSDNGKIQDMKVFGKSSQDGTPTLENPVEIKSVVNPTVKVTNEDNVNVQSFTVNDVTLCAVPVKEGGNITVNGQQYIADYIDVENGKIVKYVKKLFLKPYQWSKAINKGVLRFYASTIDAVGINGNKVIKNVFSISSHFAFVTGTPDRIGTFTVNADGTNANIGFAFSTDTTTTSDDFNNWILNNKPFVFLPVLKEELPLTSEQILVLKKLSTYYPTTNISVNSEQLDGYTVFNYPISMENGWNYVKQQIGDTRDYIYDMDLQSAEAYVNSEYAVALTELEV